MRRQPRPTTLDAIRARGGPEPHDDGYQGLVLKLWRQANGISTPELARALAVTQPAIVRTEGLDRVPIERGDRYLGGVESIVRRRATIIERGRREAEEMGLPNFVGGIITDLRSEGLWDGPDE